MNKLAQKWLAKDLYEVCPICDGSGQVGPNHPDDQGPTITCPECLGQKLINSGITVRDVEQLRARVDALRTRTEQAEAQLAHLSNICRLITGEETPP
jgi:hypothetical protein